MKLDHKLGTRFDPFSDLALNTMAKAMLMYLGYSQDDISEALLKEMDAEINKRESQQDVQPFT